MDFLAGMGSPELCAVVLRACRRAQGGNFSPVSPISAGHHLPPQSNASALNRGGHSDSQPTDAAPPIGEAFSPPLVADTPPPEEAFPFLPPVDIAPDLGPQSQHLVTTEAPLQVSEDGCKKQIGKCVQYSQVIEIRS